MFNGELFLLKQFWTEESSSREMKYIGWSKEGKGGGIFDHALECSVLGQLLSLFFFPPFTKPRLFKDVIDDSNPPWPHP